MRKIDSEDAIRHCGSMGFETLAFALSFYVRCRSASMTALPLGVSEEEEKWRRRSASFRIQKLKTAAQATKGVYASVPFQHLRLSSDVLCACHLFLVWSVALCESGYGCDVAECERESECGC